MAPRFIERLERQSQAYRDYFGAERAIDPPSYSATFSRSSSMSEQTQSTPPPQYEQTISPRIISSSKPMLPKNCLVLVTGADSFQGSHIVNQLLAHGFRVRGAVVNSSTASWMSRAFGERYGADQFTTITVPHASRQGAFDTAVRGCSGVIYCAVDSAPSPDPTEVIAPSIAGAINALEAAEKEILAKRFVHCSGTAAAVPIGGTTKLDITSNSWNMSAFMTAWQAPPYNADRLWSVHSSKELQTEQAVWRWHSDHRPFFTLNTVLPGTVWGKMIEPKEHIQREFPSSIAMLKHIWNDNAAAAMWMPSQHFIDVQDSATLHIAALLFPDVQNQRIFAVHTPYTTASVQSILRKQFPYRKFHDLKHSQQATREDTASFREAYRAEELLRRMGKKGFVDIETSIMQTCEGFISM